jgi:hypothetical protein
MWKGTYPSYIIDNFDDSLKLMLNAKSIQEVVNYWFRNDPPRSRTEYDMAAQHHYERILRSQPFITDFLLDLNLDQTYRIVELQDQPTMLLTDWTRTAVAEVALGNYQNGIAAALGIQATMCQFGEDEFLKMAAKTGFGIWSLMISKKIMPEYIISIAGVCIEHVCGNKSKYSKTHNRPTIEFCGTTYELARDLALIHHHETKRAGRVGEESSAGMARIMADSFDEKTYNKFQMRRWVDNTLKGWGIELGRSPWSKK